MHRAPARPLDECGWKRGGHSEIGKASPDPPKRLDGGGPLMEAVARAGGAGHGRVDEEKRKRRGL